MQKLIILLFSSILAFIVFSVVSIIYLMEHKYVGFSGWEDAQYILLLVVSIYLFLIAFIKDVRFAIFSYIIGIVILLVTSSIALLIYRNEGCPKPRLEKLHSQSKYFGKPVQGCGGYDVFSRDPLVVSRTPQTYTAFIATPIIDIRFLLLSIGYLPLFGLVSLAGEQLKKRFERKS